MIADLSYALRQFSKAPGFTCVAVLTLALGLGANITLFGMVSFLFFRPLPVRNPDQLVYVTQRDPQFDLWTGLSWANYRDLRREVPQFADAAAILFQPADISTPGKTPERTWIECVSGNYFDMLGIQPSAGRLFLPSEGEKPGADPIVVLSHDYWMNQFGGRADAIGSTLVVNGKPMTIIGVTPPTFHSAQWALAPRVFAPATMAATLSPGNDGLYTVRNWNSFKVIARLKPGASLEQARAAVSLVGKRLDEEYRKGERPSVMGVQYERLSRPDPSVAGPIPFVAAAFMAMVLLVLLIACANVANLLLARAAARNRELGIRSAVGATRWRLVRQLVSESLVLASFAGVLGFILSLWVGPLLAGLAPQSDMPVDVSTPFDWNSLWFALAVSFVAGIATGLMPALRASSVDILAVLHGSDGLRSRFGHWFRNSLVVAQVAFSVVVLFSAGLFLRSLARLASQDLGFRNGSALMASVDLKLHGYAPEKGLRFAEQLADKLRALPDVDSVSYGTHIPFSHYFESASLTRAEASPGGSGSNKDSQEISAGINRVGPDFLHTLGVTLVRGRDFTRRDGPSAPRVAIVNLALAERLWPHQEALGRRLRIGSGPELEVVGVVSDGRYLMLSDANRPYAFIPFAQNYGTPLTFLMHRSGDSALPLASLHEAVAALDDTLPVYNVRTVHDHVMQSALGFMPLRLASVLAGAQGLIGLVLAIMGIYAVVAFAVVQRNREIGIRRALGARNADVLSLVLGGGMRLAAVGVVLGLLLALAFARALSGVLFGLNTFDVPVFTLVAVLITGISFLACYLPARKAVLIDPVVALRAE